MDPNVVVPIRTLGSFPSGWTIQARVTNKSSMCHVDNMRVFFVELRDEDDEINSTVSSDYCAEWEIFYERIQLNNVYNISGGDLTPAYQTGVSSERVYVLLFTNETTVLPCDDEATSKIPTLPYFSFVSIGELLRIGQDAVIDIIGIRESAENSGNERTFWIKDRTGRVQVTLSRDKVQTFNDNHLEVVAVKRARICVNRDGLHLKTCEWGHILVNPDLPEARTLREWYSAQERLVDS